MTGLCHLRQAAILVMRSRKNRSGATSDTVSLFGGSEASGEEVLDSVPEVAVEVPVPRATGLQLRAAWQSMDAVDMPLMFQHRPELMRSVPHFLQGPFRNALLMALEEACHPAGLRKEREWKLLMLLPRLLLHKPPRGSNVPRHKLVTRFEQFAQGQWGSLILDSVDACEIASRNRARRTRRPVDDVAKRAERAQTLVMMGEVSAGRQALEGAALALGNMTRSAHQGVAKGVQGVRTSGAIQVGRTSIRSERQVSTPWGCSGPVGHDQRPFAHPLVSSGQQSKWPEETYLQLWWML